MASILQKTLLAFGRLTTPPCQLPNPPDSTSDKNLLPLVSAINKQESQAKAWGADTTCFILI